MKDAKLIAALRDAGIKSDTHHATAKKAIEEIAGQKPDGTEWKRVRALLEEAEQAENNGAAEQTLEERQQAEPDKWGRVVAIAEETNGKPTRVVIACTEQGDECEGEREIATQDLFQVRNCPSCQKVAARRRRAERRKAKRETANAR